MKPPQHPLNNSSSEAILSSNVPPKHTSNSSHWFLKRWNVGTIAGIPIYFHWSLPVPIIILVPTQILQVGWPQGGMALLSIPITMLIVTIHELGHCGGAALFKMKSLSITLTGIGGIANIVEGPTATPKQKLIVAAAGPAVNVVILLIMILTLGIPSMDMIEALGENPFASTTHLYTVAFFVNAAILLFNLIPVYPMDGGRILKEASEIFLGKRVSGFLIITGCFAAGCPAAAFCVAHGLFMGAGILSAMSFLGMLEGLNILGREKAKRNLQMTPETIFPE